MAWFKRDKAPGAADKKVKVPEGLLTKCVSCKENLLTKDLEKNINVCPKCGHHYRIRPARGSICSWTPAASRNTMLS